jgi:hypothetical protein
LKRHLLLLAGLAQLGAVAGLAMGSPGLYTEFQGANPFVQTGTSSVFINDDDYATCAYDALRVEVRPQFSGVGVNCVAIARLTDDYTLGGPAGTTIPVTATLDVHYSLAVGSRYDAQLATELHAPGVDKSGFYEQRVSDNGYETSGNPDVSLSATFDWTVGDTHELVWRLAALGLQTVHVDAGNTATVGFQLPSGYTVTSSLGFVSVPEPTAAVLVLPVLALAARRNRGRRSR